MSELQKVPIAVIGVGEHGKRHTHALKHVQGAELAGVYDQRQDRAAAVAAELGVRAFRSLEEALEAVQAVSIVIPTTDHMVVARLAMEAGKDVLLEKPITRTLEEADELIEIADRTGRILQVGHLERFNPGAVAAKAITRQPLFFEIHRLGVFSPRSLDVDVVFDLMIHDLDLVLWFANTEARDVRAVGLPVLTDRVDIANARVEFENGAVANFTASRVSTEKVRKFRYFQPHEYVSIDFSRRDALLLSVGNDGQNPQIAFRKLEVRNTDPLEAELESFADCVRTRRPPLVGGRQGRSALALAEKVMFCIEEHAGRVMVPLTRPAGHSGEL
ncbi:MAG: Gfo/Idh/MocA family oxidoreductase [Acidobacteria bacterium]|nr:MAG: Gfo/Idh/MocA family oxidoreductase [Acidobacteriota bacterium]